MTWLYFWTLVAANLVTWALSVHVHALGLVLWTYIAVGLSIFLHIQVEFWWKYYQCSRVYEQQMMPIMAASLGMIFIWPVLILFALAQEAWAQMKHAARRAEERNE